MTEDQVNPEYSKTKKVLYATGLVAILLGAVVMTLFTTGLITFY